MSAMFTYHGNTTLALAVIHLGEIAEGMMQAGDPARIERRGGRLVLIGEPKPGKPMIVAEYDESEETFRMTGPEYFVRGMSAGWPDAGQATIEPLASDAAPVPV